MVEWGMVEWWNGERSSVIKWTAYLVLNLVRRHHLNSFGIPGAGALQIDDGLVCLIGQRVQGARNCQSGEGKEGDEVHRDGGMWDSEHSSNSDPTYQRASGRKMTASLFTRIRKRDTRRSKITYPG